MRKTSLEALKLLIASRSLGRLYTLVLDTLNHRGPATAQEIDKAAKHKGLWKRLSELKRMGLVEETGIRECRVTGHKALTWRVSNNPKKPVEKKNKWFIVNSVANKAVAMRDAERAKRLAKRRGTVVIVASEIKKL